MGCASHKRPRDEQRRRKREKIFRFPPDRFRTSTHGTVDAIGFICGAAIAAKNAESGFGQQHYRPQPFAERLHSMGRHSKHLEPIP